MTTKTLKLEDSTAKSLYKTATVEFKAILEESFGKEFFSEKITDRINSLDDVLRIVGNVRIPYINPFNKAERSQNAYALLQAITEAYNEGWTPDFNNSSQPKYYLWFEKNKNSSLPGARGGWVVYCCSGYVCSFASGGFSLYFETKEKALDAGKKFINVFNDYLPE